MEGRNGLVALGHGDFFSREQIAYLLAGLDPNGKPYSSSLEAKAALYRAMIATAIDNALRHAWEHVRGLTEPPPFIAPDIFDFDADELPSNEIRNSVGNSLRDPANVPILLATDPWYTEQFQRYDIHAWATARGLTKGYRFDGVANDRLPDVAALYEPSDEALEVAFDTQLENLFLEYYDVARSLSNDCNIGKLEKIGNWQRIVMLDRTEDGELYLGNEDKALLSEAGLGYVRENDDSNSAWRNASIKERCVALGIHIYCRIISGQCATYEEILYLFRLASETRGALTAGLDSPVVNISISDHARTAADARHSRPGGSREKRRKIQEIWKSGKYSSRDICAEQECAALGMSFSTARKALRGIP